MEVGINSVVIMNISSYLSRSLFFGLLIAYMSSFFVIILILLHPIHSCCCICCNGPHSKERHLQSTLGLVMHQDD